MSRAERDATMTPGRAALTRLTERYPLLDAQAGAEFARLLTLYVSSLNDPGADRSHALDSLLRLVQVTQDAGAPAVLLREYMLALDEFQIPMNSSRGAHAQALADLAEIMRRETGEAAADAAARAQLDPVSGLPTRSALHRQLELLIENARSQELELALLCVNLHHSTPLLDQPGHATQEALAQAIIARLRGALRPVDVLSGSGHIEFLVVLPGLRSAGQAMLAAHKLSSVLTPAFDLGTDTVHVTHAIGIATWPHTAAAATGLLHCAQRAAEEARADSEPCAVYSGSEKAEEMSQAALESDLLGAIENNELELHFQPQLELGSGRIRSVEALLRWQRRPGEWISPYEIIRVADQSGRVRKLSDWIIKVAVHQAATWQDQGLDITISVNLWAKALLQESLPDAIEQTLRASYVSPDRLLIEITEGEMIKDMAMSREVIRKLKGKGLTIAMDDFGTGYSHLSWLRDLEVDEIKIDQLFVRDLLRGPKDEPIVRSVIGLAHELGLIVVAEGVEDQATQDVLVRMGCDRIQGYWLSRPLAADACTRFLREHAAR